MNYLFGRAKKEWIPRTRIKIQKLVYIANGRHLALLDRPLIREKIGVRQWDPVISDLYHDLKKFRNQPVTRESVEIVIDGTTVNLRTLKMSCAGRYTNTDKIVSDQS